ncbi:hypothetical protein RAS1_09490 [Phycisphaerae bacterium RAS1]|nr:hypothetical protein RAS1_09490 [Phycisphaerae bacterium RAS1]
MSAQLPFEMLEKQLDQRFAAIDRARAESDRIELQLLDLTSGLLPPDTSIVIFGSFARREWTAQSDVDWTLLVDGQADPEHHATAQQFGLKLKDAKFSAPGRTNVFGRETFSHELIHCIGGENDTNTNMTRRLLLLLEPRSLSRVDAHSRVIRGILKRYLDSERSFITESGREYKVPRFLLNDIVRYWRTVAVDYVNKQWERGEPEGWALRNIKLRFSRKLLFVSGLLRCFGPRLGKNVDESLFRIEEDAKAAVLTYIVDELPLTPIDLVAKHALERGRIETAKAIFTAYDYFLERLGDEGCRDSLKSLRFGAAFDDRDFKDLRDKSREFDQAINKLFFDDEQATRELIMKYGVF